MSKGILDTNLEPKNLKKLYTIGGAISVIILSYYITGIYMHVLEIKRLKEENKKNG